MGDDDDGLVVPDDLALAAEAAARHGAHGVPLVVGGVVHGVVEVDDLERGDEGAGRRLGAARQAHAHAPALPLRHHLEVGGHAAAVVVGGVDGAPAGAVDDLVEHGRVLAAVEAAVEVGGPDEVARALDHGELVAVLARRRVGEEAQGGEHRQEVGLVDGGGVADGGEALIPDPLDAPCLQILGRPAAYVEPCCRIDRSDCCGLIKRAEGNKQDDDRDHLAIHRRLHASRHITSGLWRGRRAGRLLGGRGGEQGDDDEGEEGERDAAWHRIDMLGSGGKGRRRKGAQPGRRGMFMGWTTGAACMAWQLSCSFGWFWFLPSNIAWQLFVRCMA